MMDNRAFQASNSGHFIWVDQPDVIIDAVKSVLNEVD
jgi:pimeloyl-ACP methyl ester carboxylesterase